MRLPNIVIPVAGFTSLLAMGSLWVEYFLLIFFNAWYFSAGPRARVLTGVVARGRSVPDLAQAIGKLPLLSARQYGTSVILVRQRLIRGPFGLDIPPLWSARLRVIITPGGDAMAAAVEMRYGLPWLVLLATPFLFSLILGLYCLSEGRGPFLLVGLAMFGPLLAASVWAAHADASRVLNLLKNRDSGAVE